MFPIVKNNSSKSVTAGGENPEWLCGKRVAVVVFSHYPSDPRPRRAAEALSRLGMNVEVICLRQDKGEPRRETREGIRIRRVSLKRRRGGKFSYVFQYAAFLLISLVLLAFRSVRGRYHLVHVHNMPDILVFAAVVPKVFGSKVILDLHDPMPELMTTIFGLAPESFGVRLLKNFERWSIRFAHAVLTVNQACKRLFTGRGCPPEKVLVVMNSPDEGIFKYRETAPVPIERNDGKPFVIMYHGSLVERHGLDVGVSALGVIKQAIPRAELRIYGQSTPFLERVLNSVRGSDLEKSVRYFGPRTLEQIVEAIDECDVGIIPNRRSIFTEINTPTRIFEYLSRGKPVIAPAVPGILDYFSDGQLIFFELGDANDLARKLEYVCFHPEEVEKTVRLGQAIYREHKWSAERAKFTTLVGQLLAARN
ncbi:MAG TPA: glycosyltransferase family 4 protein [Candidatus Sulfopaludibacter sp.]|nr:glycosyltransferase family 4 protein [Candidatus Sulfopaludibacter sp.]